MINLTARAAKAVQRFVKGSSSDSSGLRLAVYPGGCAGLQYTMQIEAAPTTEDKVVECNGVRLFLDAESERLLEGLTIDFVDTLTDSGFSFHNPNATATCGCGKSFSS